MYIKQLPSVIYQLMKYSFSKTKIYYYGVQKRPIQKAIELLKFYLKEHQFFSLYYAMGYNIQGTDYKEFLGKPNIFKLKAKVDNAIKKYYGITLDYDIITKDKFYAGAILRANGFPCLEDLGLLINNEIILTSGKVIPLTDITQLHDDLVLKNTILEASEGVLFLKVVDNKILLKNKITSQKELKHILKQGVWIIQKKYQSHKTLRKVNDTALNVLRITTVLNGHIPIYLGGFQAFATGNAETDTWSGGSIYIGIDIEKNCLKKNGFRSPWHDGDGLVTHHPDSNIKFENYPIPFLQEAIEMCLRAHRLFYTNFLLGWDVAITDSGAKVVEINEGPGMNVLQCTNKGIRTELVKYANRYID